MLDGLTPFAQNTLAISIAGFLIGILVLLFIVILKRGVKFSKNDTSVTIGKDKPHKKIEDASADDPEETVYIINRTALENIVELILDSIKDLLILSENRALNKKMDYVETKLTALRGLKETRFYKALKDKGIQHENLTSHPDALFYNQVLGNVIYHDNGTLSIKSLFRTKLRDTLYLDDENLSERENEDKYDKFMEDFYNQINEEWRRKINANYKSDVFDLHMISQKRVITTETLYDLDTETAHLNELKLMFKDIFDNARQIHKAVEIEKKKLTEQRNAKLDKLLNHLIEEQGKD